MKRIILAGAAVMTLGVGTAFADGPGAPSAIYTQWFAAACMPTVPATQWYAMTPQARLAMVQRMQQVAAASVWPSANWRAFRCAKWELGYRLVPADSVAIASAGSAQ